MVVIVDRHLAEQDQVARGVPELRGQGLCRFQAVGMESLDLEQHAAIGAHRERGADRLLSRWGTERDDDDFARPGFLLQPQRFLDGELVVRVEDELDAGLVQRLAVRGDLDARLGIGDALDANGYFHKRRRYDATL